MTQVDRTRGRGRVRAEPGAAWRVSLRVRVDLTRARVIGIVNTTPDSFFAPSRATAGRAVRAALAMIEAGAVGVDIGGESTRPGAAAVEAREQARRVVPVVRQVARRAPAGVVISVDTTSARVAAAALDAGANAINDVSGGRDDAGMLGLAGRRGCGLILMHRLAPPGRDEYSTRYGRPGGVKPPRYGDVVLEVGAFLAGRAVAALEAGVRPEAVVIDPGLGFGKTAAQNLELIERTGELAALGWPVMSALSRKSFVGWAMGLGEDAGPEERLAGSIALSLRHVEGGARLLRVHDVPEHVGALAAWRAAGAAMGPAARPARPTGRRDGSRRRG